MDFRLAPVLLGIWLGILASAVVPTNFWRILIAILVTLVLVSGRMRSLLLLAALAGFILAGLRFSAIERTESEFGNLTNISVQATLLTDVECVTQRSALDWQSRESGRATIVLSQVTGQGKSWQLRAVANAWFNNCDQALSDLVPGTALTIEGSWRGQATGFKVGSLNVRSFNEVATASPMQRWTSSVRKNMQAALSQSAPIAGATLVPGLVIGDTSRVSESLELAMKDSGLTHLVAVSGANVTLLVVVLMQLLRRFQAPKWLMFSAVGSLIALFVLLVRAEPSVLRAATMAVIALVAVTIALPKSGLPILFAAASLLLLWYPWLAQSWGFALSCFATFGLLLWAGQLRIHPLMRRFPNWLAEALGVTVAAQFAVFILLIALGGSWSPLSIIANVLAAPFASWVMVAGLLFMIVASVAPTLAHFLAFLVVWPAHAITLIATLTSTLIAKFPVTLPWPDGRLGIVTALLVLLIGIASRIFTQVAVKVKTNEAAILAVCLAVLLWQPIDVSFGKWPASNWVMVSCDVGQGDSTVLRTGKKSAVVVDVGGDEKLVAKCLDDLQINQIDLLVLTHFHADHVGGLAGALKGRNVLRSVATSYREPKATVDFVTTLLDESGLRLENLNYPAELNFGSLSLTCLWPTRDYADLQSPINNSSVALLAKVGGLRILLPGDLEPGAQTAMLKNWASSQVDVLKIAHHGSRYQALDFAAALSPRLATISVGKDNDYGHPAPETILMYSMLGTHILRTDELGSIAIYADPLAFTSQKVTGSWQTR